MHQTIFAFGLSFASVVWAAEDKIVAEIIVRDDPGSVHCLLYNSKEGFPWNPEKSIAKSIVKPKDKKARCEFAGIKPGDYAIEVFHDQNGNGRLDTDTLGIPTEGVGTSNNAKGHWGPPRYEEARFRYSGKTQVLQIHMTYL